jgi:hypothetical protein
MQLTATKTKEDPLRTATLFAPVIAAEKRLVSAPKRFLSAPTSPFEINRADLIPSVEISEEEILDDLLYPSDHRALGSGGSESGRLEPR